MEKSELTKSAEDLQKNYYEENGKSVIFKNSQKAKCAEYLANNLDMSILLKNTAFIIPNTNKVLLDYTIFKTYAHESIYEMVIQYILNLFSNCIDKYGSFDAHINLKSFTISAAQRYGDIIKLFCSKCLQSNTRYASHINNLVIYNTPSMIDTISKMFRPFINDNVRNRIDLKTVEQSTEILHSLEGQN